MKKWICTAILLAAILLGCAAAESLYPNNPSVHRSMPGLRIGLGEVLEENVNTLHAHGERIIPDTTPPVLHGLRNYRVREDEEIPDYSVGVTATDDRGDEVKIRWDNPFTGTREAGLYTVYFYAEDMSGNIGKDSCLIELLPGSEDTVAPVISGVRSYTTDLDKPVDFMEGVTAQDNTDPAPVITVDDGGLDFTVSGVYTLTFTATDASGNSVCATGTVTVLPDDIPPEIHGCKDITAVLGETIKYKQGVTVSDNHDKRPKLTVNTDAVDLKKTGKYKVTYIVSDAAGNKTKKTVTLTIIGAEISPQKEKKVYELAQKVLDEILTDDMSDMQKAYTIYRWVRQNIRYIGRSDKSNWVIGAYDGLTTKRGDCYNYFAVSKALLTQAGIDNEDIEKSKGYYSMHYWNLINLGNGWYHFDACPSSMGDDNFFMLTDAELAKWDRLHRLAHPYDGSLYPKRATKSVQQYINYNSATLKKK